MCVLVLCGGGAGDHKCRHTQEDRDMVGEKYLYKDKEKRMQTWGNLDHSEQLMSGHLTSGFRLPSGFGTLTLFNIDIQHHNHGKN